MMFRPLKHWGRIIAVPFMIATAQVHAADGEINLSCQGVQTGETLVKEYAHTARDQPRNVNFSVTILATESKIYISSSGDGQADLVVNKTDIPSLKTFDRSTDSEWNIANITQKPDDYTSTKSFVINRLTGRLSIQSTFETAGAKSTKIVEATCQKLDPSKKKF